MSELSADVIASLASSVSTARRIPLNEQLAASLEHAIGDGTLRPGAVLPREPDLAKQLGLSRQTVALALNALARRGLLVRRRGIGTFVAEQPVEQPLDRLYSFVRTLAVDGQPLTSRLLGTRLLADPEISSRFGSADDALVLEVSRLFSIDDAPFAYELIYLPASLGEQLRSENLAGSVIYELLRDCCDIVVTHGDETMRIAPLTRSEASLLHESSGAPAFLIERIAYAGDRAVELRRTIVRGDRTRFRARLAGPYLTPVLESAS